MARTSQRLSGAGTSGSKHKRAASSSGPQLSSSKRSRSEKTKSRYFAGPAGAGEDDNDDSMQDDEDDAPSTTDETASEFDVDDGDVGVDESAGSAEDDDESEEETPSRGKKGRQSGMAKSAAIQNKTGGSVKVGGKTGIGPGTQVIIKKPKARPAGKVPYAHETIHPNTLLFLADLKANNKRDWLKSRLFVFAFRSSAARSMSRSLYRDLFES